VFLATGGPLGVVVLALGLAVGVSRCYLGVHYPGDVLVGWSLATATVAGVMAGFALV
jgi:undecaprenyl-diphosphatase